MSLDEGAHGLPEQAEGRGGAWETSVRDLGHGALSGMEPQEVGGMIGVGEGETSWSFTPWAHKNLHVIANIEISPEPRSY